MLQFLLTNARWIGGGMLLTVASSFGQTFFIALSAGGIRQAFDLSHGEFGGIYMLATLASAATLPFLGKIVDRVSVRRTLMLVATSLAVACVLMAVVPSVLMLLLALYGLRLFGQGMMTHTAMTAMGRWYDASRGRAVSVVALGHQMGEMLLPLAFIGALTLGLAWRDVWLVSAAVLAFAVLPIGYTLFGLERTPERPREGAKPKGRSWTRAEVLRDPIFYVLMLGVLAPAFIGTTLFFHQIYLIELRGWNPIVFASGFTSMGALTIAAGLATGWLIDRVGSLRVLPFFPIPLAASCLVVGAASGEGAIFAFFSLLGISYGMSQTLFGALWPEVYGTKHLGAVRSVTVAMMVFATAAGPGLTGGLIDAGFDLPSQMVVMGMYSAAIAVLLAFVARTLLRRDGVATPASA